LVNINANAEIKAGRMPKTSARERRHHGRFSFGGFRTHVSIQKIERFTCADFLCVAVSEMVGKAESGKTKIDKGTTTEG
jgi:hypothetical protein